MLSECSYIHHSSGIAARNRCQWKWLSTTLSLSRTPVREALIELNRIGLVEILPQRGSYISKIDYNIVEESRFLRLVTENAILKLLCDKIADADMDPLIII